MIRHDTATAIILNDQAEVLLIEHPKLGVWLGPGGHIEADEDPEQALRREVTEEVGLAVDIIGGPRPRHAAVRAVTPPWTINVQDIPNRPSGEAHQHIDHLYVCAPSPGGAGLGGEHGNNARWVPIADMAGVPTPPELPGLVEGAATHAARCGAQVGIIGHEAWLASLPAWPAGASILFRTSDGRVLLVQPTYRMDRWQIPGGTVDEGEGPAETARREVSEELGLAVGGDLRLLSVDWVRQAASRAIIQFTFDGGVIDAFGLEARITLADGELADWSLVGPGDWPELLSPWALRRVRAALAATEAGATVYLEDGWPADDATAAALTGAGLVAPGATP